MTRSYVLDACALIAFLNDETGADSVESLLIEAAKGNVGICYEQTESFGSVLR